MVGWGRTGIGAGAMLALALVIAGCGDSATPATQHPATSRGPKAASGTVILADTFTRTVAGGWGTPDSGPAWQVSADQAPQTSVDGSSGLVTIATAQQGSFVSIPTQATDLAVTGRFHLDKLPVAENVSVHVWARGSGGADTYRFYLSIDPAGAVVATFPAMVGNQIQGKPVAATVPSTYAPGTWWRFRVVVSGSDPTHLQARVWADGTTEPTTWLIDTTDTTPQLQQLTGRMSLGAYTGAKQTALPLQVAFDDVSVAVP